MPLSGTFDVLDFSEVLRLLARQHLTGRLHVRSRSYGANLFLEEGALVGADQSEHQAAAASGDVRGRLEEICFEMLDAERGSFEFQLGRPTAVPGAGRLRIDTVLARARRRLQQWQELQEAIPSLELQPRLAEDLSATEITIDQERWRMLTVIDGRRNLRAIGRSLGLSDFDVCRLVKGLIDDGVVELDGRAAALASAGREPVPTVPGPDPAVVRERVRVTAAVTEVPADTPPGEVGPPATPAAPSEGAGDVGAPAAAAPEVADAPGQPDDGGADDDEAGGRGRRRLVRIRPRTHRPEQAGQGD